MVLPIVGITHKPHSMVLPSAFIKSSAKFYNSDVEKTSSLDLSDQRIGFSF